jgi:hypothetical protein
MSVQSIYLNILAGANVPVPVSSAVIESIDNVQITTQDKGRSGFQINLKVGRSGLQDLPDYSLLRDSNLDPFNRVIISVVFNATPRVLMDGIITHRQLTPSNEPGASRLTLTGEDISVMMDLEEKNAEYPAQNETVIAYRLIGNYTQYGLIPKVIPPNTLDTPSPTERIPVQENTDLQYLQQIAERYGYVFYIIPGPVPMTNTAYWGPPVRSGTPQKALSVNMGSETNVSQINFTHNVLLPTLQTGEIQDRSTNESMHIETFAGSQPPLSTQPAWSASHIRMKQFRRTGLTASQAFTQAQGLTDTSMENVVTASGELNALSYGEVLEPRALVELRGSGYTHNGTYYVKQVTHKIKKGEYKQSFTLTREGIGSQTMAVLS